MAERPPFANGLDVQWVVPDTQMLITVPDMALVARRRWWSGQWELVGSSPSPWPKPGLLYIAFDRLEHGYWRDVRVGDATFDRRYFVFCDPPALAPLLVGPGTRGAIDASFDVTTPRTLTVHVHDELVETESTAAGSDRDAVQRHAAVHRALAADAREIAARWQRLADTLGARVTRTWPPMLSLLRPIGEIVIDMRWRQPAGPSASEWVDAEESLATVISAVDARRDLPGWRLVSVPIQTPTSIEVGKRWLEPRGKVPDLGALAVALAALGVSALACDREVSVSLVGLASEARVGEALRLVDCLVSPEARSTPYR